MCYRTGVLCVGSCSAAVSSRCMPVNARVDRSRAPRLLTSTPLQGGALRSATTTPMAKSKRRQGWDDTEGWGHCEPPPQRKWRKEKRANKKRARQREAPYSSPDGALSTSYSVEDADAVATRPQYVGGAMERAVGVDYGQRFTGVALSAGGIAPRVYGILDTPQSKVELAERIAKIAGKEGATVAVVGIPVTLRGSITDRDTDSQQGRVCRNFATTLAQVAASQSGGALQVVVYDEANTSEGATLAMSGSRGGRVPKGRVDGVAACLLLSRYFDSPWLAVPVEAPIK